MRPIVLYICTDNEIFAGSSKSLFNMIMELRKYVTPIVLFSRGGITRQVFQEAGIETWEHPFTYVWQKSEYNIFQQIRHPKRSIFYQWYHVDNRCVSYVREMLSGRKLALVHTNTSVVTVGADIAKAFHVPHIWHIREFQDKDFNISPFMGKIWLKYLIKKADARIFVSNAVHGHWNIKTTNNYVIRNVIVSREKQEIIITKQKYFLYCAAQVRESKGASLAVEAFCQSNLSKNGYSLFLIGFCEDDYRGKLIAIAKKNDTAPSHLKFLGYQKDVSRFFREATAFLMCSKCEGLGRVTIEAMYNGCPVIAFASGGTTEIVSHNETGVLFNNKNELIKEMKEVVMHNQLPLLENAQNYAISNFTQESVIPQILIVYNKLLEN